MVYGAQAEAAQVRRVVAVPTSAACTTKWNQKMLIEAMARNAIFARNQGLW